MKAPRFEVYKAADGWRWRWRWRARNGEVIASGEAYTSKRGAIRGASAVKRNAAAATYLNFA